MNVPVPMRSLYESVEFLLYFIIDHQFNHITYISRQESCYFSSVTATILLIVHEKLRYNRRKNRIKHRVR